MWDKKHGGFFWQVKAVTKTHSDPVVLEKHAYGNSFGIYASASAYRASKDLSALQLAMDGFQWLDSHAHDNANGGYFEFLTQTGTPIHTSPKYPRDFIGTKTGFKSMNTHIHLLEAFSELYLASHDSRVKSRLMEVFLVVRDKIYTNPGCLNMFFNADWKPIPDYDSFGHDIETAFLLVEAAHVLGKQNDMKTTAAAKHLVDHALDYGYDPKNGGFYDSGPTFGPPSKLEKVWWTQAEGLNALLLMHLTYRSQTRKYWDEFVKTWNFVKKYQVDQKNGGWYSTVSTELTPEISQNKSDQWKDPYHQGRAMLNIMEMLQTLEDQPRGK